MTTALTTTNGADIVERVVMAGDLGKLTPADRVSYYRATCESVGLNPLTRPFDYITLNGKLTLYARKDATDQLRRIHRVSVEIANRDRIEDVYIVTARATTPDGRTDESTGAVTIGSLKGDALANALMKAETKAKRRVTLSICGMGWLDETEIGSIPDARPAYVDQGTGEIIEPKRGPSRAGLIRRLNELANEARELGFNVPDMDKIDSKTDDELMEAGKAFRVKLDALKAERAAADAAEWEAEFDAIDAAK